MVTPERAWIWFPKRTSTPSGTVTHAFDMGQRFMWLTFTRTSSGLTVKAPTKWNDAPPGYYMLFLLTSSGVPSKAKILRLG